MRPVLALALAALSALPLLPASGAQAIPFQGEAESRIVAQPYAAASTARLTFDVASGTEVLFQVHIGAAAADGVTLVGPGRCRASFPEAAAGDVVTLDCGHVLAGRYSLRIHSFGAWSAGAVRSTGAHFPAPSVAA